MSRGINKVIIIGNLGQDPDSRSLPSGKAVCNLSVATSESWTDKSTGEKQERTEWHRIVTFGRLAEICAEYLRKGSKVYFEGKLQTRKWQADDGTDRYSTEIVAHEMQMLDSRSAEHPNPQRTQSRNDAQQNQRPAPPPANQPQGDHQKQDAFDDDIPF